MYELKINNQVAGIFKTLKAARNYQPDPFECLSLGIFNGNYIRMIKKLPTAKKENAK